jgi:hypothetical protein
MLEALCVTNFKVHQCMFCRAVLFYCKHKQNVQQLCLYAPLYYKKKKYRRQNRCIGTKLQV